MSLLFMFMSGWCLGGSAVAYAVIRQSRAEQNRAEQ